MKDVAGSIIMHWSLKMRARLFIYNVCETLLLNLMSCTQSTLLTIQVYPHSQCLFGMVFFPTVLAVVRVFLFLLCVSLCMSMLANLFFPLSLSRFFCMCVNVLIFVSLLAFVALHSFNCILKTGPCMVERTLLPVLTNLQTIDQS